MNYEGIGANLALTNNEAVPDANAHLGIINGVNVGVASAVVPYLALYPNYGQPGGPALPPGYKDNAATGIATFLSSGQQPVTENYIAAKLDHQINAANNLSGRVVSDRGLETDPWFGATANTVSPGDIAFPNLEKDPEANLYVTVQERFVVSANLINVATVAFVRTNQDQTVDVAKVPAPLLVFNQLHQPGSIAISNVASIPAPAYEPLQQLQNTFTEQDQLSWIHGAHTFTFGGGLARIQCACVQDTGGGGQWTFPSLTAFLENQPSNYGGEFITTPGLTPYQAGVRYSRQNNISVFGQDDWRVTKKLTINLGLRDDYITNPVEAKNNFYIITNLDPLTCSNNPACDGGTPEPGVSTNFSHVNHFFRNNPSTRNIDPRIGLAWDVFGNGRTAFRAAYGVYHSLIYPHYYAAGSGFLYPNGTAALVSFSPGDTFPTVPPGGNIPQMRSIPNYNVSNTAYMQEWNATVEQQLPWALKLSLGYVGSNGIHLSVNQNANTNIPTAGTQFRPFSPAAAAKLPVCIVGNAAYSLATCNAAQAGYGVGAAGYQPNVAFTSVQWYDANGTSNYNSGVLSVSRSFSSGVQFSSGFTYSQCLDTYSNTTSAPELGNDSGIRVFPSLPRQYSYGHCAFYIGKNWTSNALIPLPFRGNRLKEGWQLGIIETVHTGNPLTANLPSSLDQGNLGNFTGNNRANVNPNFTGPFYNLQKGALAAGSTTVPYFNPNAFEIGPLGMLGNASRESINGPNGANVDLSVIKKTSIPKFGEAAGLELRGDFFNALNHTNFGLPNSSMFTGTAGNVAPNATAGQISTIVGTARQLQFSARFVF